MRILATYPLYEIATDRQTDLLAAGVDAWVEYIPTGMNQVYFGALPVYALVVPEAEADAAWEVLRLVPDESHQCLFRCPKCGADNVRELGLDEGFGVGPFSLVLTLGVVAAYRVVALRRHGRPYQCCECANHYRLRP